MSWSARRLRKMEIPYLVVCYGLPFIPAFSYLFIRDKSGVRVYGDAGMWCWIITKWDYLRIATFYGPIWYAELPWLSPLTLHCTWRWRY